MVAHDHILQAIGKTPLIRLNVLSQGVASTLYGKAEFLNPGGSTKDRIALAMIEAAEKIGKLQPEGTIITGFITLNIKKDNSWNLKLKPFMKDRLPIRKRGL